MTPCDLRLLHELLEKFRDESVDREEFGKREDLRFDVEVELYRHMKSNQTDASRQPPTPDFADGVVK